VERDLNLAAIGNCQIAALLDARARIVWCCMPRLDSDPVFFSLVNGERQDVGVYELELKDLARHEQRYLRNTAMLETILYDAHGGAVRIVDFAPRLPLFDRVYRPMMIIRLVEPLAGQPMVRVRLRPSFNYGAGVPEVTLGSHHVRFVMPSLTLRLTTSMSVNHVLDERWVVLDEPVSLVLGPDESITESVMDVARKFLRETQHYWQEWVRGLAIPFEWQEAVIRAAITLKLCTFEDTGAVVAALTTSIPEVAHSGRNWDYRFCWLRDSYFVVHALNRLGATKTMREYLRYMVNISANALDGRLQPVYGIGGESTLEEFEIAQLAGYRGMGPVRVGNQAYQQTQHDIYGSVVLAATQLFFDERLPTRGDVAAFERLEALGHQAVACFDQPDAGLWEYRGRQRVHTFSSVMCWAACDRLARIAARLGLPDRAATWAAHARHLREVTCARAWDPRQHSFTESWGRPEMDASLLMLSELGFLPEGDPRFRGTLAAIENQLRRGQHLFRYAAEDDFGAPANAFNLCTFWYIDALHAVGRVEEARELFENILACRNPLGLLSEDLDPGTGELWGNFPQTYSMVGIIKSAMRLSRSWEEAS